MAKHKCKNCPKVLSRPTYSGLCRLCHTEHKKATAHIPVPCIMCGRPVKNPKARQCQMCYRSRVLDKNVTSDIRHAETQAGISKAILKRRLTPTVKGQVKKVFFKNSEKYGISI